MFLQNQKYDILFELAIKAFQDGYYNQAVFSFMASLERFHEFCIRVMMFDKHKDNQQSNFFESFEKMWKMVKKQSERQYGMFISMYFSSFGKMPKETVNIKMSSAKKNIINYRNDVIHNGLFSNHEEAFEFGELVANYMKETVNVLRTELTNESIVDFGAKEQENIKLDFYEKNQNYSEGLSSTQTLSSYMSLALTEFPQFQSYLMSGETAFDQFRLIMQQEGLEYKSSKEEKDYKIISMV